MVKANKTVNINELMNELQEQGIVVNAEDASTILDFLNLAASILVNEKCGNENS